ncbi:MAG: hypothetical protein AAF219_03510 [Myxococcota bacterium]
MNESDADQRGSGVQALIDRLRSDGVEAGQQAADKIESQAKHQAAVLVAEARKQADSIVAQARDEARKLTETSKDALKTAMRDSVLRFSNDIMQQLENRVERLVSEQMVDTDFLRALIRELVVRNSTVLDRAERYEVSVPMTVMGVEELKNDPAALGDDLSGFAKQIASAVARDGIELGTHRGSGLRVLIREQGLEIDFSAQAVADLVMQHLRPRFRALMMGIIQ